MNSLISVIIPSFKRKDTLKEAVLSVCNQTYKNFEIIVVNDCGIDTKFIVDEIKVKYPYIPIFYYKHDRNKGLGATRNTGIKNSNGDFIAFLDDDDLYYPEHLEKLVNALEKNQNYKIAYTFSKKKYYLKKNEKYVFVKEDEAFCDEFDKERLLIENYIPVNAFLIKKEIFTIENYWFDESLRYLEDWDLWIRLSKKYNFLCVPELTCEVRRIDNSLSTHSIKMYRTQLTLYKRYPINKEEKPFLYVKRLRAKEEFKSALWILNNIKKKINFEKVSIIVPCENNLNFFEKFYKSYTSLTLYPNKEVILINSNTKKNFLNQIENKLKELKGKCLFSEDKLNLAQMLNIGVEYANGEYIIFLINTIPALYWITLMVKYFEKLKDCGLIGGKILTYNNFIISKELKKEIKIFNINDRYCPEVNKFEKLNMIFSYILFLRKKDFYKIDRFDEKLNDFLTILNFAKKINKIDKKVYYNPFSEGLLFNNHIFVEYKS